MTLEGNKQQHQGLCRVCLQNKPWIHGASGLHQCMCLLGGLHEVTMVRIPILHALMTSETLWIARCSNLDCSKVKPCSHVMRESKRAGAAKLEWFLSCKSNSVQPCSHAIRDLETRRSCPCSQAPPLSQSMPSKPA